MSARLDFTSKQTPTGVPADTTSRDGFPHIGDFHRGHVSVRQPSLSLRTDQIDAAK